LTDLTDPETAKHQLAVIFDEPTALAQSLVLADLPLLDSLFQRLSIKLRIDYLVQFCHHRKKIFRKQDQEKKKKRRKKKKKPKKKNEIFDSTLMRRSRVSNF
jgi:hypothetical protein